MLIYLVADADGIDRVIDQVGYIYTQRNSITQSAVEFYNIIGFDQRDIILNLVQFEIINRQAIPIAYAADQGSIFLLDHDLCRGRESLSIGQ
ncbi:hypothetical protein D3C86_1713560 [compost metagenome]